MAITQGQIDQLNAFRDRRLMTGLLQWEQAGLSNQEAIALFQALKDTGHPFATTAGPYKTIITALTTNGLIV